ncbi:MAG: DUF4118 domain-containing protein, partial [Isosphaeraceae bacterium]
MPGLPREILWRYGLAVLLVGLAVAVRLVLRPILGDGYPFFLCFVAIVLAASYGGYGPSLVALVLSWFLVDSFFLVSPTNPQLFHSRSQIALAFFAIGLSVAVLGGRLRKARERVWAGNAELQEAFESQQAEREWLQITLASIADAVITTDPEGRVTSLNPVAARLTGWSLSEAVGR